ncbi:MAG: hypothetical protein ABWZ98_13175 [Nakamurella sp.]
MLVEATVVVAGVELGVLLDSVVCDDELCDEDSDEVVFDDVVFDDVVFDDVVFDDVEVVAAAPAAAVPVTPDAHAVSDTTDKSEIPARAALMDDRMMLFSQCGTDWLPANRPALGAKESSLPPVIRRSQNEEWFHPHGAVPTVP